MPVFSGRARKEALREIFFFSENFPKGRYPYFSLVRKVPKVHQRAAALWTPGDVVQSSAQACFL